MSFNRTLAAALIAGAASLAAANAYAQAPAEQFGGAYVGIVGDYSDGYYKLKNAPVFPAADSQLFGPNARQGNTAARISANDYEVGGTVGWNYQSGALVAGFEGDLLWSNVEGALRQSNTPFPAITSEYRANTRWAATARARIGYAAGPFLAYGTAGFASQEVNFHRNFTSSAGTFNGSGSRTYLGFAYGAGAELKLSQKVSFKAEYLRFDTGVESFDTGYRDRLGGAQGTNASTRIEADRNVYRVGFNYHF